MLSHGHHHIRQIYAYLWTEEPTQDQLFPYYLSHCDTSSNTSLTQYSEQCSQYRDGKDEYGGTNFYGRPHHNNREVLHCVIRVLGGGQLSWTPFRESMSYIL